MISPHELKNKAFTRVMRGYNPSEVDEHFDFVLAEYTDLYKENDELVRRIAKLEEQLAEYSKDSEAIRTALLNAQKVSTKIVDEANAKAELIIKSVKESCDAKLEEIKSDIVRECEILNTLRRIRGEYEEQMRAAIDRSTAAVSALPELDETMKNADDAVRDILQSVRDEISTRSGEQQQSEEE